MRDEFWFGEGANAKAPGTSIPFGTSSYTSLIRTRGTVVNTGTAKVFTGTTASPTFTTGHTFTVDTGWASGPVPVTLTGITATDFVNSVLTAFPDGEVTARKSTDAHLELILYGGASLTISVDPTSTIPGDLGNALVKAGFLTAQSPPVVQSVTLTAGTTINPGYIPGNTFIINTGLPPGSVPTTVTLTGATAQDFANAVNTAFPTKKVVASVSAAGRIDITGNGIPALKLTEGTGMSLAAAGLRSDTILFPAREVRYFAEWPANPPILKAGETLTYSGGEHRADHPEPASRTFTCSWAMRLIATLSIPSLALVPPARITAARHHRSFPSKISSPRCSMKNYRSSAASPRPRDDECTPWATPWRKSPWRSLGANFAGTRVTSASSKSHSFRSVPCAP